MNYFLLFIKKFLRFTLKPLSFVPAIIMMYVIFSFSAQDGNASTATSLDVTHKIISFAEEHLNLSLTEEQAEHYLLTFNHYVRKAAHMTEYFIFAAAVAFPLYVYGMRGFRLVLAAGFFCIAFAVLDEFHQSFSPGRSPSPKDVLIDTCGIIPGIYAVRIAGYIGRKTVFKSLSSENLSLTSKDKKTGQFKELEAEDEELRLEKIRRGRKRFLKEEPEDELFSDYDSLEPSSSPNSCRFESAEGDVPEFENDYDYENEYEDDYDPDSEQDYEQELAMYTRYIHLPADIAAPQEGK